jgi:hypothetical protein
MAQRLTYVGPFDSIEQQVGDGRFELVRSANPAFDGLEYPPHLAHVADAPTTITVSDELAELLLAPAGVEPTWIKAGGRASSDDVVDDPSLPALRWSLPVGDDLVEPVTGYVSPADLAKIDLEAHESALEAAQSDGEREQINLQRERVLAEREAAAVAEQAGARAAARQHAAAFGEPEPEFVEPAAVATAAVAEPARTGASSASAGDENPPAEAVANGREEG